MKNYEKQAAELRFLCVCGDLSFLYFSFIFFVFGYFNVLTENIFSKG